MFINNSIFGKTIGEWLFNHTGIQFQFWRWDDEPLALFKILRYEESMEDADPGIEKIYFFHIRFLRYDLTLSWEPAEERYIRLAKV